ncbi:MAG: tetratricopeptide repeat protein [Desulfobacterales bacterium]|nr:tetratricopeptide repeat protein [Desulfobacterales bacterium]
MTRKTAISLISISIFVLTSQALADENLESAKKLFGAQEYNDAIRFVKKVVEEQPSNAEAWLLLGDCYSRLGKDKKAIRPYQEVIRIKPEHADAVFRLGVSFTRLGQHSNAIEAYKQAVRIQPEHAQAHFYLGVSYDRMGRVGDAFEHYKILKTLDESLADELYRIILGSS